MSFDVTPLIAAKNAGSREVAPLEAVPKAALILTLPKFKAGETVQLKPEYLFPEIVNLAARPSINYSRERPLMKVIDVRQEEKAVFCLIQNEYIGAYTQPFDEDTLLFVPEAQ